MDERRSFPKSYGVLSEGGLTQKRNRAELVFEKNKKKMVICISKLRRKQIRRLLSILATWKRNYFEGN